MNKIKKLGSITLLIQILSVIPFFIITFYFDKIVYGEFAKNISVISILGISSVLKLDIYNIEKKKEFKFQQIIKYLLPLWVICLFVLYFNDLVFTIGCFTLISIGLYDYTAHNLLQNNLIKRFNQFRITRIAIILLLYNIFWFFELSVTLLLLIEFLSKIIPFLLFYPHQNKGEKFLKRDLFNILKITFSWFINNSVTLLIPFILSENINLEELGWYYIFFKGINQIEILLASTLNQYLISLENKYLLKDYKKRLLTYSLILFIAILIIGFALSYFISYKFDYYTDLFIFAMIITFLSGLGSPFYVILNKLSLTSFQLKWDICRFIIFISILLLTHIYGFNYFIYGFPFLLLSTYVWMHFKILKSHSIQNLNI